MNFILTLCEIATFRALAAAVYIYVMEKKVEASQGKTFPGASARTKLCADYHKIPVHQSLLAVSGSTCTVNKVSGIDRDTLTNKHLDGSLRLCLERWQDNGP